MSAIWQAFMPIVALSSWSTEGNPHQHEQHVFVCVRRASFQADRREAYASALEYRTKYRNLAAQLLEKLSAMEIGDAQIRRDLYDIARTILGRYIDAAIFKTQLLYLDKASLEAVMEITESAQGLMKLLAELLATHEDYSLYRSLKRLKQTTDTNPNFEETLKNNAESSYCRSFIYENAQYLYIPELSIMCGEVRKAAAGRTELDRRAMEEGFRKIKEHYFAMPLAEMEKAKCCRSFSEVTAEAAKIVADMRL